MAKYTVSGVKPIHTSQKKPNPKATKLPASSIHPPYFQMITEAIASLKDRTGSSQPAIAKFMEEKYKKKLPPNFKKMLSVQLKRFLKSEKLVKVKNSYKISATQKTKKVSNEVKEKKIEKKEVKKTTKKKDGVKKVGKSSAMKMKRGPSVIKKKKVLTPKKVPKSIKSPKLMAKKGRV
ncbi:histone H1-like [Tasmannia lanceolata]|uniref:histone H1-like n=1 Tax=Tasmannia lanceolata TaxID=3420 RepID=UPI004063E085